MSVQSIRLLLRSAAITLLLLSAAVVVWAFQSPGKFIDQGDDLAAAQRANTRRAKLVSSPPLADFSGLWEKDLRRPLYDLPEEPKNTTRKERKDSTKKRRRDATLAEGGLQLVGTMLEDGRSVAVFMNSSGKIDLKGVGDTLDLAPGTRVDHIDLREVTISNQGRATTLRLPNVKAP